MADVASRQHITDSKTFLTQFSAIFTPPQDAFWTLFHLSDKVTSKISLELLTKQTSLELWRQLPMNESVLGMLGSTSYGQTFIPLTQNSVNSHNQNASKCWSFLPSMCDQEVFHDENNMFVRNQSKYRCGPLPRVSNWMENQVHWLQRKENIIGKSANFLKATDATTRHQNSN
jgi:hypothetical protein